MRDFVHLHVHTEYSLLDGSARIKKLVKRAKELNMKAIAITDHGSMYGVVDFYKACIEEGIKPIIGCEVYVAQRSLMDKETGIDNNYYHLVLLAKNEEGYRNLMKIDSKAFLDGFYYRPRTDYEELKKYSKGLIATSACLGGEVQSLILNGEYKRAREKALLIDSIFGRGNFFLELQNHGIEEQKRVNDELIEMSKETGIPLVATNDVHYIKREDSYAHEILLCIQTGKTIDDEDRMEFKTDEFYLKPKDEMEEIFKDVPSALDNTVKIADMCSFDFEFHKAKLPKFDTPEGKTGRDYLRELCYRGLYERYGKEPEGDKIERLEYELSVIEQMGFVDYFLIVWDFIRFANEKGIVTGPGRGSAAGSIVAFCLGITKIDPIKYNLIFERFLNPERVSMPDIDSDFCYERRQEVIDYVIEKYGSDRVAQIITFGTMAARAAIRDVGRALNYSYAEVDKIAKMIPMEPNMTIDRALEMNIELKKEYEEKKVKNLIDISRALEGLPRHSSTHAAGVVISAAPVVEYVPLAKNDETVVTQFTMTTLEELGLLKMDFLGLRNLTVIRNAIDLINKRNGINFDIDSIDFEKDEVYEMLCQGQTEGVFQLESKGMTNFMKELKPKTFEDIIAGISLYRPGPMEQIPVYIKNKNNPNEIKYLDKRLEDSLGVTYGCIIYQEQVMQIVRDVAGYSLGRADLVRRAMSKKKHAVMEQERKNFIYGLVNDKNEVEIPGAIRRGYTEEVAKQLFGIMTDFASYGFNKSHAAAYAVLAYQTAYLRLYYKVEFMAAILTSVIGNNDKVASYIQACKKMGISVLPPDINESYKDFTVVNDNIRFGLAAIKNVGMGAISAIIEGRRDGNFKSFVDFCERVNLSEINKRAVESMIKAGAFDSLNHTRRQLLIAYERIMDSIIEKRKNNITGQMSLFNMEPEMDKGIEILPEVVEFEKNNILAMEKEITGLYISGHPLDDYMDILQEKADTKISDIINVNQEDIPNLENRDDGKRVVLGGIISGISIKPTKKNDIMAFINIEDIYGTIEVIVFPKIYHECASSIIVDNVVIIRGRISHREEEQPKLIAEELYPIKDAPNINDFKNRFTYQNIRENDKRDYRGIREHNAHYTQDIKNNIVKSSPMDNIDKTTNNDKNSNRDKITKNDNNMGKAANNNKITNMDKIITDNKITNMDKIITDNKITDENIIKDNIITDRDKTETSIIKIHDVNLKEDPNSEKLIKGLYIRMDDKGFEEKFSSIKENLLRYPGKIPVIIVLRDSRKKLHPKNSNVSYNENLIDELEIIFGNENVKYY